jgi:hypothetical protein
MFFETYLELSSCLSSVKKGAVLSLLNVFISNLLNVAKFHLMFLSPTLPN